MVLVCNVCVPKPNDWTYDDRSKDKILVLAKWYPVGAYYRNDNGETLGQDFLGFLDRHQHLETPSEHYTAGAGQENPVRIEYESEGLPIRKAGKR